MGSDLSLPFLESSAVPDGPERIVYVLRNNEYVPSALTRCLIGPEFHRNENFYCPLALVDMGLWANL